MSVSLPSSIAGPMRLLSRSVITLHVEDDSVRLLVAKGGQITHWGSQPLGSGLVRGGVVADQQAVGMHVRSLLASNHIGHGKLIVGLTGQRSVPRILDFPEMSPHLLGEAIPREMKRQIPVPLEEMHLSWQVVGSENGHLRVFALGVPRDVLAPLLEAIKLSGKRPHSMDIKPLSLVRAVGRRDVLIADLEPEGVDVIVVRDGIPATIRTVSLGPQAGGIEDKVRRLGEELRRTVKFYCDTCLKEALPPSVPVCLTGSLAEEVASSGIVEVSVAYPVELLSPPLGCPPDLPLATFMVNIGLALKET
jgi:hypothetical protein